jgi:acetyl-CoA acyltransferase
MSKQVQEAYIVAATRTPVGKAPRGMFRNTRPDDMLAHVIKSVMAQAPGLDPASVVDVIVGCAMPEAEQGTNVARIALLLAGLPNTVPGVTINRFCSSGVQAVAMAADRIRLGEADVMLAAGVESMSMVPMMGNKIAFNPAIFERDENIAIAYGMGLTAEKVAERWKVSREAQDAFALQSHQRAIQAISRGIPEKLKFKAGWQCRMKARVPTLRWKHWLNLKPYSHRRARLPRVTARNCRMAQAQCCW